MLISHCVWNAKITIRCPCQHFWRRCEPGGASGRHGRRMVSACLEHRRSVAGSWQAHGRSVAGACQDGLTPRRQWAVSGRDGAGARSRPGRARSQIVTEGRGAHPSYRLVERLEGLSHWCSFHTALRTRKSRCLAPANTLRTDEHQGMFRI